MRRRDFVLLASASVAVTAVCPPIVRAQGGGPAKIGWLKIQDRSDTPGWLAAFRDEMRRLGQQEGRTFVLEERYADGDASRLAPLAEDLARTGASIIVATSQPATDAARRVTTSIPIVGRMTDDPLQTKTARSLAQPGGNVTGVYSLLEEMSPKRLALLREAVPTLRRVGVLLTLDRGATRHWLAQTEGAAERLGLSVYPMDVSGAEDLPRVFAAASKEGATGFIAFRNPTIVTYARQMIDLSNRYRLPGIFDAREYPEAGAFMSYGPNLDEIFRRCATYADRILKGARPADLAIEQSAKFELVINVKAARALDLDVPSSLLLAADEVIE